MSTENLKNAAIILERVKKAYDLHKDADLARFLESKPGTISSWKARNSIDYDLVLAKCNGINLNWLLAGEGEAFPVKSNVKNLQDKTTQQILAELDKLPEAKKTLALRIVEMFDSVPVEDIRMAFRELKKCQILEELLGGLKDKKKVENE
jgi:hypothetical protein